MNVKTRTLIWILWMLLVIITILLFLNITNNNEKYTVNEAKKLKVLYTDVFGNLKKTVLIYPGMIALWPETIPPLGWAICDGTNGTPDLRGKFVVGTGNNLNPVSSLKTNVKLGDTGGNTEITLGLNDLPPHTHFVAHSFERNANGKHSEIYVTDAGEHKHTMTYSKIGNEGEILSNAGNTVLTSDEWKMSRIQQKTSKAEAVCQKHSENTNMFRDPYGLGRPYLKDLNNRSCTRKTDTLSLCRTAEWVNPNDVAQEYEDSKQRIHNIKVQPLQWPCTNCVGNPCDPNGDTQYCNMCIQTCGYNPNPTNPPTKPPKCLNNDEGNHTHSFMAESNEYPSGDRDNPISHTVKNFGSQNPDPIKILPPYIKLNYIMKL